ncbi:MAG: hypothetical protein PVI30_26520 [Myxococcales bacterium]|jgi:hypothetical protein
MTKRWMLIVAALGAVVFGELPGRGVASAQTTGGAGYLARGLTLSAGQWRIDAAPPDWGYMEHGEVNRGRGFRLVEPPVGDTRVYLGAGGAYGITNQLELGGLVLPLRLAPDGDLGDLEAYLRYAFTPGGSLAAQVTVRIPTDSDLAVGIGLPAFVALGGGGRLETGVELELIDRNDTTVNIDVPLAFQFAVTSSLYAGPRTGVVLLDLDEAVINLGGQIGGAVSPQVELSASVNLPNFLQTYGDTVNLDWVEIIFGATFLL